MASDRHKIHLHEDKDLFRAAVDFTAAVTNFPARLIEKDYYCSRILEYVNPHQTLVFKGGTCLAKVYTNFYRLSEDLDFVIPMPTNSKRTNRQKAIEPIKGAIKAIANRLPYIRANTPLTGANNSTQYVAYLEYDSLLAEQSETIKFEVSLREPLHENVEALLSKTILLDPVSNSPIIDPIAVRCISKIEAYAEKCRAALTRIEPAIRDFFDLDYAERRLGVQIGEAKLIDLVRSKLKVPGNKQADVSDDRLRMLRNQLESELKPVLRNEDYNEFDLDRSFGLVRGVYAKASV